jgi:hypothetical protein
MSDRKIKRKRLVDPLPNPKEVRYYKGGQPVFEPTMDQRRLVMNLIAANATKQYICTQIINPHKQRPIDAETLNQKFAQEIRDGLENLRVQNSMTLFKMAQGYSVSVEKVTDVPTKVKNAAGEMKTVLVEKKVKVEKYIPPDLGAAIWIDKTRNGMREGAPLPNLGPDGKPLPENQIVQQIVLVLPGNNRNDKPVIDAQALPAPQPALEPQPASRKPQGLSLPSNGRS